MAGSRIHDAATAAGGTWLVLLALLLLLGPGQVLCAGSSKVACDYSNRLCQWNASYAFGATVLGDLAFFHGGLYSNDATTPVNGSFMEVMDLRTMSPYLIQVEHNQLFNTSRYNHHLAAWKNQLVAVGGQVDDGNGKSNNVLNVLALDLNTRTWRSLKNFTASSDDASYIFDAVAVSGDFLLAAFQVMSPVIEEVGREYLAMDLNTGKVDGTYKLYPDVRMLDWPLIGIMSLTADGSTPHLVLQAKREMPSASDQHINWFVIGKDSTSPPLACTVSTKLKQQQGGTGGSVLALNILQVQGKPKLVMLATSSATFKTSTRPSNVTTVTMFDINVSGSDSKSVGLQLSEVLLTPPLGLQLADIRSADLPLIGSVAVTASDVTLLPYVGRVGLIGTISPGNVNIQGAPGGFVIKGSGLADQSCQPGATWQPFVYKARFDRPGTPDVVAVSNYTWCPTRLQQIAAAEIISSSAELGTNTKLFRVNSQQGTQLMLLNAQTIVAGGGRLKLMDTKAPLKGAFVNLNRSSVTDFIIKPDAAYKYPLGLSSCVTSVAGQPVYVETGGYLFNAADGEGRDMLPKGVFAMDTAPTAEQHSLAAVPGGDAVPARAQAALACSPDGKMYVFGGLDIGSQTGGSGDVKVFKTSWMPTNGLHTFKLSGSAAAPRISKESELTTATLQPAPRSGHAMTYLAPAVASKLGMAQGALVLYGGSNVPYPTIQDFAQSANETESAAKLRTTSWDTSTWLFDLGASKWVKLTTEGAAPPGLMYHSMEAQGAQVVVFGGQAFNASASQVRLSTMLYVLDFSSATPRWRAAQIRLNNQGAFQFGYPNTGVVLLPEFGAVALKHRSAVNLAPIPQSLQFDGATDKIMQLWGLNTLNTTAGDWVRLAPSQPRISLQQPVLVAADIIVSGVAAAGSTSTAGRHLLQQPGKVLLDCGSKDQLGSAVMIRSGGAQLSNFAISGCGVSAVDIQVDATGAYITPAVLSNVSITGNNGSLGAAISIGPTAAAKLQDVTISGNVAEMGNVFAAARSGLELINCTVSDNRGSAIIFAGSNLVVSGSRFTGNAASRSAPAPPAADSSQDQNAGGALRLLCFERGPGGYDSVVTVSNTTFSNNRGINGGAVYAGAGTTLLISDVIFSKNGGYEGGGVFADRDACLESMTNVSFSLNSALERGGAVKMHNPSCNTVSWSGGSFRGNTAADGGALYLTELTTRTINGSAVYEGNLATRQSSSRGGSTSPGGAGGAIYLGLWGSNVFLHNSTFVNNSAANLGGAVHALAIDRSSVELQNVNATGNAANFVAQGATGDEYIAATLRSEGGALHVDGSVASVTISNSTLAANMAGRGGAVSMNTMGGSLSVTNSNFSSNEAWTAGGAVAVTERKSVSLVNTRFSDNRLWWKELAAGGGFYCFLCNSVNITSSTFARNRASYGGGAAVLQPWQPSVIINTSFVDNVALPDPSQELVPAATNRRRALLSTGNSNAFAGSKAVNPQLGGQAAAAAILGPLGANVTGDSGYYTGGGGLYVSLSSRVSLQQCAFIYNSAYNGGGFLARTDACKPAANSTDSTCQLLLSEVSVRNNTANAAGGALITNIRPEVLRLDECSKGTAVNPETLSCLQAPNALIERVAGERHSSGRSLLQQGDGGSGSAAAGGDNVALSGSGNMLLSSAASVKCQNMQRLGPGSEPLWIDDDCSIPIRAPPGQPFGRSFVLLDGFGQPISSGIYDARMPMAAGVNMSSSSTAPYRLFGNTTTAQDGVAKFTGLTVNGKPGDTVTLVFRTQNGLTVSRQVILRSCQAGEYTDNSTSVPNELSFSCRPCQSPQFSFYPSATGCSQCASLPPESWAVCNEAAVVPADGFYQSHPRSPVLSRCISSFACRRTDATRSEMASWAYMNSNLSTAMMTPTVIAPYMERMCLPGYTGPLCGACEAEYGHAGSSCVNCLPRSANTILYFLVCCFMFIIPVVQMVLHSKNVDKNTRLVEQASKAAAAGVMPWAGHPSFQNRTSNTSGGASFQPNLPPLQERPSQSPKAAAAAAGTTGFPSPDRSVGAVELANMQARELPGRAELDTNLRTDQSTSSMQSWDMVSPFSEPSAVAGAIAVSRDNSGTSIPPLPLPDVHESLTLGPTGSGQKSSSLFQRLFDVSSLDDTHIWGVAQASSAPRRVLQHNVSSMSRRGPSGTSVTSQGSMISGAGSPMPETVGGQPAGATAAGEAASGGLQMAAGGPGGALPPGVLVVAPTRRTVHRRTYKFWHADILSMLVNYMQLLGLLRLVRINWAEQLSSMLTYLDFTSGATTWVSVECSMNDTGSVPRSARRSVVVLLWPLAALVVLGIFWSVAALFLRTRPWARRVVFFKRWMMQHVVMSVVILFYYLYTSTTREIISLFSCQQVDDPARLPEQAYGGLERVSDNPSYLEALLALPYQSSSWLTGYWTSDTNLRCGSPVHLGLVVGLGIPGVLLFSLGLPIGLWVLLWRTNKQKVDGRCRLEDPEVELQFGAVYDKYRYSCYYWECIVLLEAFLLTLMLVMLQTQNNAALQVLVAMAIMFLEAVLHITFQPYACRLLYTLRRLAVYGLMSTLFLLMLVSLSEVQDHERLVLACMIIVALLNAGVIAVHLWACAREVKRWLLWAAGKDAGAKLTWADIMLALPEGLKDIGKPGWNPCGACSGAQPQQAGAAKQQAGAAAPPVVVGAGGTGPPAESEAGPAGQGPPNESAAGPSEGAPREGVVVVINPAPPAPPAPGWLWRRNKQQ